MLGIYNAFLLQNND